MVLILVALAFFNFTKLGLSTTRENMSVILALIAIIQVFRK